MLHRAENFAMNSRNRISPLCWHSRDTGRRSHRLPDASAPFTVFLRDLQDFLSLSLSVIAFVGMRPPSRPFAVLTPRYGLEGCVPQFRMPTLILSTLALLGCVFLIYVFFHWLRDELNPKRPVKRGHRQPQAPGTARRLRHSLIRTRSTYRAASNGACRACVATSTCLRKRGRRLFSGGRCNSADRSRVLSTGSAPEGAYRVASFRSLPAWRRGCHTSRPSHISRPMMRIRARALLLVTTPSRSL